MGLFAVDDLPTTWIGLLAMAIASWTTIATAIIAVWGRNRALRGQLAKWRDKYRQLQKEFIKSKQREKQLEKELKLLREKKHRPEGSK